MKHNLIFLPLLLALLGCDSEIVNTFKNLRQVTPAVEEIVEDGKIKVELANGTILSVTVMNSNFNEQDKGDRRVAAARISRAAFDAYPHRERLERIDVSFVSHRTNFFVVEVTETLDSFEFSAENYRGPEAPEVSLQELSRIEDVGYSAAR